MWQWNKVRQEEARERQRDLFLLALWPLPSVRVWKHILLLYLPNPATVRARTCTTYTVPGLRPSTRPVFVWLRRMVELISAWSWKEQKTWKQVREIYTVKVTLVKQAPVAVVACQASCLQETLWDKRTKFGGNQFRLYFAVVFKYEIQYTCN